MQTGDTAKMLQTCLCKQILNFLAYLFLLRIFNLCFSCIVSHVWLNVAKNPLGFYNNADVSSSFINNLSVFPLSDNAESNAENKNILKQGRGWNFPSVSVIPHPLDQPKDGNIQIFIADYQQSKTYNIKKSKKIHCNS